MITEPQIQPELTLEPTQSPAVRLLLQSLDVAIEAFGVASSFEV